MSYMHPYENLSLFTIGLILGVWLIAIHALMLVKSDEVKGFLKKFPRNLLWGQILMGVGLAWFWLLIAPENLGKLSALVMDFGEFNGAKPILRILVPLTLVGVVISVRDFLAVRALGVVGLMAASPLLEAAFLKDPSSRLLVPIYAYAMITVSLFLIGKPYLFRDAVTWISADEKRWKVTALLGLGYGLATLICAIVYWRGY